MIAFLFLILLVCMLGAGATILSATVTLLRAVCALLDALVQQVPGGAMLFIRLAAWVVMRLMRASRYLWRHARRIGVAGAQRGHAAFFVWSYFLREWYVASELRKRNAH